MRNLMAILVVSLASLGCLPQYEDPPLTATGEAPENWSASSSKTTTTGGDADVKSTTDTSTGTSGSTCSGTFNGTLTESSVQPTKPPCVVAGTVSVGKVPGTKFRATLAGIQEIGILGLNADVDLSTFFPKLTKVGNLQISGGGSGQSMQIPYWLTSLGKLSVSNTALVSFNGNNAVTSAETIGVSGNNFLTTFNGFPNMTVLTDLVVTNNPALTDLNGFMSIQSLHQLEMDLGPKLTGLGSFSSLKAVTFDFTISGSQLQVVGQFPQLSTVASWSMGGMPEVTALNFPPLTTVKSFAMGNMAKLASLDGLGAVTLTGTPMICLANMPCAALDAWVAQHAPGKTNSGCGATTCKQ